MPATTRKGVWDLQQVRDQYLEGAWEQQNQLWSWGRNLNGPLGQNNTSYRSSPVQIPGTQWSSISGGDGHSLATKTDGTLWAWGTNQNGQLSQNNTTNYSSPQQIPGTAWSSIIVCGIRQSFATKTDGTLWAWGQNDSATAEGSLGQNDIVSRSSPVQVPGTQWSSVHAGAFIIRAKKTDGTLWAWGYNYFGALGLNDKTARSSPVQVPGTQWSSISGGQHSLATKTDGTLWAWGLGSSGPLGQNDIAPRSSPTQVPGTQWSSVSASIHNGRNSLATKTDGTLWSWGNNVSGQLGQNNTVTCSSPIQIPGTSWSSISAAYSVLATKTDGTLWAWGQNYAGALAQNNTSYRSSPTQIPGTQWGSISSGSAFSLALKSLLN